MSRAVALSAAGVVLEVGAIVTLYALDDVYPPIPAVGVAVLLAFLSAPFLGLAGFVGGLLHVRASRPDRGRAWPGLVAMAIGTTTWPLPVFGCLLALDPAILVWQVMHGTAP